MARIRRPGEPAPVPAPAPVHRRRNNNNPAGMGGGKKKKKDASAATADDTTVPSATQYGDDNPEAAWSGHWTGFGVGNTDPNFSGSNFETWFNENYYDELRNQWQQSNLAAGDVANHSFWPDWLKINANPEAMRARWAQQSSMTKGLQGRQQINWLAY
jgi:hypothetical protein